MRTLIGTVLIPLTLVCGCGRKPPPHVALEKPRPVEAVLPQRDEHGAREPRPLEQQVSLAFDGVLLPEVVSRISREKGVAIGISPSIPLDSWSRDRVGLRMSGVPLRAVVDWLVRPLQARYAVEGDGGAWLCRGDELLDEEPLEVRSYRVPTHMASRVPIRGALVYEQEQRAIIATLHACLRYMEDRRPGCHLAFYGSQDVLVARLPARGHARLEELLDAMRFGAGEPEFATPSAVELRAKLNASFDWALVPGPANRVLTHVAEAAGVNLGWDANRLDGHTLSVPVGRHTLREVLDDVAEHTPLGRYGVEAGRGIWLYSDGEKIDFAPSGATPWDRAFVRAYDLRPLVGRLAPEAILAQVRKRVDPGQWASGLPAAAVFVPSFRLIVVHDEDGQRRVAAVVRNLTLGILGPPGP